MICSAFVMCSKESVSPTAEELHAKEKDVEEQPIKEKKKKKHKEKRKRSCSTDSTSSTSSHKRHKKKKKKKKRDEDPPSPRVNPIFLWVKQDHTKIVEVLCEDYDKRNRIRLTKTPGGWVAIPRTARLCPMAEKEESENKETPPPIEVEDDDTDDDDEVKLIEVQKEEPVVIEVEDSDDEDVTKETECIEGKCCPDANVDENHNNEVERPVECADYCVIEDDHDQDIEEEVEKDVLQEVTSCPKTHQENCENLMNELADMCFVDNFKEEGDRVLDDIYTFVPSSPEVEKEEIKSYVPVHEIKKPATPDPVPINLVVHSDREEVETKPEMKEEEPLKQSELESLDILWRLPEGTTISHSKPLLTDTKPLSQRCTPQPKPQPTFSLPVQEEPLNLGKPKPKEEKKKEDSKLMELLQTEERPPSNALDQLKEVLSDPDLSVPDPLLVPRGRLPALIANPAKEIPRLLAQKREIKYPKIDADLMVVSLSHLQSILQRSGGEEDLKPYGQQMVNFGQEMDPATLNQMLWLPYLSQLERKQNQELMTMLYPHYVYPQQYTPPPTRYPAYTRPSWPRPETSKPSPPAPKETEQPKQKLRLKVKDHLIDPNFKRTSLLNLDPPAFMPPVGVPPNSNLWHPLFSR